jgi:uncharacterized protein YhdP
MTTTFAGCVSTTAGNPKLSVALPADCEQLSARVPAPAHRPGDDARAVNFRYAAALNSANDRLDKARACTAKVRERFAAGAAN